MYTTDLDAFSAYNGGNHRVLRSVALFLVLCAMHHPARPRQQFCLVHGIVGYFVLIASGLSQDQRKILGLVDPIHVVILEIT